MQSIHSSRRSRRCVLVKAPFAFAIGLGLLSLVAAGAAFAEETPAPAKTTPAEPASPPSPVVTPSVPVPVPAPAATPVAPAAQAQPAAPRVSDPQAEAIVETYLKTIGGRDTLGKIKDRTTKFVNTKSQATGDTDVEINLLMKKLDGDYVMGIREEWDVKGFDIKGMPLAFTQIYNGRVNEAWVLMLGTVSALDGKTLQVFVWDKQIDDFFYRWKDDGYILTLGGQGLVSKEILGEDHPCDVVVVTDFSGRSSTRHYFSRKNGLLLKKEWQDAGTNPKAPVKKEQYYKDYRDIGFLDNSGLAVKFPLRLEIYVDGDLDTVRRYTSVIFNSGLSDKVFDKPEGKPFDKAAFGKDTPKEEPKEGEAGKTDAPGAPHGRRKPGIQKVTPVTPVTPVETKEPAPAPAPAPPPAPAPAPTPAPAPAPAPTP